jgi:hypothetical protein
MVKRERPKTDIVAMDTALDLKVERERERQKHPNGVN